MLKILSIDKGLRQLIDFYDYENGWNIIFLTLLLMSNVLTFYSKKVAWTVKQSGLICISITFISKMLYPGFLTILLFIYYSTNKTISRFDIMPKERFKFYLSVILLAFLLLTSSLLFDIVKY